MNKYKNKIVIIGAGNVGEAIAYTLTVKHQATDIVIIDIDQARAEGCARDIYHGTAYFEQIRIRSGSYDECADADIIIITAGISRKPGMTRLDLAKVNVGVARDISRQIMKYADNPIIIVISNPVDILTYVVQQETGLPTGRVIGSGASLDTARFRHLLGEHCGVDVRDVNAYIIGEHGDTQVPIWSRVTVAGQPLDSYCQDNGRAGIDKEEAAEAVKAAGAEVIDLKGATFYGIALTTSRIVEAIMKDEGSILSVSHVLTGEFGLRNIAISLPCIINADGVKQIVNLVPTETEITEVVASARKLRDTLRQTAEN
ncbi:MAG: L-lactate dehydrogenase [Christensenella sp.]|nr:L-lactate dehydrogenase [Christensenella sp.]